MISSRSLRKLSRCCMSTCATVPLVDPLYTYSSYHRLKLMIGPDRRINLTPTPTLQHTFTTPSKHSTLTKLRMKTDKPKTQRNISNGSQSERSWSLIKQKLAKEKEQKMETYERLLKKRREQQVGKELQKMEIFVYGTLWRLDERVCRDLCMRQFSLGNASALTNVKTSRARFIR